MGLQNKTAVVTGAGKGIGREIALTLGRHGAAVMVAYLNDKDSAEATCNELEMLGVRSAKMRVDIRSQDDVDGLLDATLSNFGSVEILVNNAAVNNRAPLEDIHRDDLDYVIDTNLKGTFLCSQLFGDEFVKRGEGRIVNISSTAAIRPLPRSHHYVASKAGIIGLTKVFALSLAPFVTVNSVAPGFVDAGRSYSERELKSILAAIPLEKLAEPLDIANVVAFLVSEGKYITGQTIVVDGGFCLGSPYQIP